MTLTVNKINNRIYPVKPVFRGSEVTPSQLNTQPAEKKKENKAIKYLAIGAGIGLAIFAIAKGLKHGKAKTPELKGEQEEYMRLRALAEKIPGVSKIREEQVKLLDKIDAKIEKVKLSSKSPEEFNQRKLKMDLDFYKDSFSTFTTMQADKLKALRDVEGQAKFKDIFPKLKIDFQAEPGVLIYGKNEQEKKKLLNYFIDEAKAHDIDVEYFSTKDATHPSQIGEPFIALFDSAFKKFHEQKKHTLIVWENVDNVLDKDGWTTRAIWNRYAEKARENGVITLTTAKDANTLDQSCIRPGRVRYLIDIDDALVKQAEIDKAK